MERQKTGSKDPVVGSPIQSDSIKNNPTKIISPNKEHDQEKIDSIKQAKKKPKLPPKKGE